MIQTRRHSVLRSKTVWGAILSAGAWLLTQPAIGVVEVVQAVGAVLTAAGVRDAIKKGPIE